MPSESVQPRITVAQRRDAAVIELEMTTNVVGNSRFAFSPLAELACSLRLLGAPRPAHLHSPWLRQVRAHLDDIDTDLLLAVAPPGKWVPSFLVPPTRGERVTIQQQLERLAAMPVEQLEADIRQAWAGRELPPALKKLLRADGDAPALLAEHLWRYWDVAVGPYWMRMCAVLEDDVSHRAAAAVTIGINQLLDDLHPEVSVRDGVLCIDMPKHDPGRFTGVRLTLVPSVFVWPRLIVNHDTDDEFELTYAARGVGRVWEGVDPRDAHPDDRISALLGRSRAAILDLVVVPMSTTQLARHLGQSPGSVSQHLAILRDSGLVTSWRSGRSVLYKQSPLGESLAAITRTEPTGAHLVSFLRSAP